MGLPVLHKRASDLLSMFVGGTEQQIADAFAEAREAQAFLVFDEADSLLLERADAVRSWEISQVNEMLTWMDSHALPFACTTNLLERLDRASLRRFLVKLRFGWLTPEQARHAFQQFFGLAAPAGLERLRTLTPADFALVRRRAAVRGGERHPELLLRLLAAECEGRGRRATADRVRSIGDRYVIVRFQQMRHSARMRYAPAERLLRLARCLAGTRTGFTLDEMATELGVNRRTAERLRDTLVATFPQMDFWDDEERVRRWRLPGSALVGIVELRAEAIAAIETAARDCGARGEDDRAALLREASTTLRAVMRPDALRQAEPDVAALMEAEGIAMRPGPRPLIVAGVLPTLRRAILGMQLVVARYAGRDGEEPATRILCPYGLLHGGRGWLVAHVEDLPEMRLWRLDRIVAIDLLDRGFMRRDDFSLADYAGQSFGVFQEEPMDVALRFAPEAAADAANWSFHPSQSMTYEADGGLTVRFRAGGVHEMCWHLFTWGTGVEVMAPEGLRGALVEILEEVGRHHSKVDWTAASSGAAGTP